MSASQPFVGEIFLFAGNFAPSGWAFCSGQLMAISENPALFSLIGTTYGGDGVSTFALPDLRGRTPLHQGQGSGLSNYVIGQLGGLEQVTLTTPQMPAHGHNANANGGGNVVSPVNAFWSTDPFGNTAAYSFPSDGTTMRTDAIGSSGGSLPHPNMQPFLGVNFIISLFGIFPTQN